MLHPWPALEHAARTWPDADALVFPHQNARRSFAQYRDEALALAGALGARGIGAGPSLGGTAQAASAAAMNRVESKRCT